ncbi:hypothetical protein COU61_00375 [Candidatus Pacearchaeota archaeon CG10_big_fil_rev_8_21_14_0_10_35_13]|nr:MAG: hypothetical protein COU61_00375 [Candidatus Pacearchaeota archaeon CG10_big_fil_rev_8_21_14_0_10_35_13]
MDYEEFIKNLKEKQQTTQRNNLTSYQASNRPGTNNEMRKNTEKHQETKNKILKHLENHGPSLPVRMSKELGVDTLFISAFLSELASQRTVRISHQKVGSSPLYYLPGQEEQLMNYEEYIKGKEKEAYEIIKNKGVIKDQEQEPAIRVAIRNLKDYAHPITNKVGEKQELYWRFITIKEEEARERITKKQEPEREETKITEPEKIIEEKKEETITPEPRIEIKIIEKELVREEKKEQEKPIIKEEKKKELHKERKEPKTKELGIFDEEKKPEKEKIEITEIPEEVRKALGRRGAEITEVIEVKKKEATMIIKTSNGLGMIEYLGIYKDKKRISYEDLAIAIQISQSKKMPCLFISPGEMNKKAEEYCEQWKNILVIIKT